MDPRQEPETPKSPQKEGKARTRRFQIVKLEERIAPDKGGVSNKPHPCVTVVCPSGGCY
jgi:hypothetical protein